MQKIKLFALSLLVLTIASTASAYSFTRDLETGSEGSDVAELQEMLMAGGYLEMPADATPGYFGKLTELAVAKWQIANGVTPISGFFGPKSRGVAESMIATASNDVLAAVASTLSGPEKLSQKLNDNQIAWITDKIQKAGYMPNSSVTARLRIFLESINGAETLDWATKLKSKGVVSATQLEEVRGLLIGPEIVGKPTVTLSLTPSNNVVLTEKTAKVTLAWTSGGATKCFYNDVEKSLNGNMVVEFTSSGVKTLMLSCLNNFGTTVVSKNINVVSKDVTPNITSVSPATVNLNTIIDIQYKNGGEVGSISLQKLNGELVASIPYRGGVSTMEIKKGMTYYNGNKSLVILSEMALSSGAGISDGKYNLVVSRLLGDTKTGPVTPVKSNLYPIEVKKGMTTVENNVPGVIYVSLPDYKKGTLINQYADNEVIAEKVNIGEDLSVELEAFEKSGRLATNYMGYKVDGWLMSLDKTKSIVGSSAKMISWNNNEQWRMKINVPDSVVPGDYLLVSRLKCEDKTKGQCAGMDSLSYNRISLIKKQTTPPAVGTSTAALAAQSRDRDLVGSVTSVKNAIESYKNKYGEYPDATHGNTTLKDGWYSHLTASNAWGGAGNVAPNRLSDRLAEFLPNFPKPATGAIYYYGNFSAGKCDGQTTASPYVLYFKPESSALDYLPRAAWTGNVNYPSFVGYRCISGGTQAAQISAATVEGFAWSVNNNGTIVDLTFTVTAGDEDFNVLMTGIASTAAGTATASAGVLTKSTGEANSIAGGFKVLEGDTATFRVRYTLSGTNGTYKEFTVTSVAGRQVPNSKRVSPTATVNVQS